MLISYLFPNWLSLISLNLSWLSNSLICLVWSDWRDICCSRSYITSLISCLRNKSFCIIFSTESYFSYWCWMIYISNRLIFGSNGTSDLDCGIVNSCSISSLVWSINYISLRFVSLITGSCCSAINSGWSCSICWIWWWDIISWCISIIVSAVLIIKLLKSVRSGGVVAKCNFIRWAHLEFE